MMHENLCLSSKTTPKLLLFAILIFSILGNFYVYPANAVETTLTPAAPIVVPGRVMGTVAQGTGDGDELGELVVTLHILDASLNEQTAETIIDSVGSFLFSNVPVSIGNVYFISTSYKGLDYAVLPVAGNLISPDMDFQLTVYEPTDDPSVINVTASITRIKPSGQYLEVSQDIYFANNSDRIYTGSRILDDGRSAVLDIHLPIGAAVVMANDVDRLFANNADFSMTDTRPVFPSSERIISISYLLAYSSGAIIEYPVDHATEGEHFIFIWDDSLAFSSEQFLHWETETDDEQEYTAYGGLLSLAPGDLIRYELAGNIVKDVINDEQVSSTSEGSSSSLLLGAFTLILIAIVLLIIYGRRSTNVAIDNHVIVARIMRQITELEELHSRGEINHDLYHRRRTELEVKLQEITEENISTLD
jgi:hypothetical protein